MAIASAPRFAVYDECPIHRITAPPDVHNVHPKPANDRKAAAAAIGRRTHTLIFGCTSANWTPGPPAARLRLEGVPAAPSSAAAPLTGRGSISAEESVVSLVRSGV